MADQREEGWYTDPYRLHDARWFSDGEATKLVRDGSDESYDPPPDTPPLEAPQRFAVANESHGDDLRRADTDPPVDRAAVTRAVSDVFDIASHHGGFSLG